MVLPCSGFDIYIYIYRLLFVVWFLRVRTDSLLGFRAWEWDSVLGLGFDFAFSWGGRLRTDPSALWVLGCSLEFVGWYCRTSCRQGATCCFRQRLPGY